MYGLNGETHRIWNHVLGTAFDTSDVCSVVIVRCNRKPASRLCCSQLAGIAAFLSQPSTRTVTDVSMVQISGELDLAVPMATLKVLLTTIFTTKSEGKEKEKKRKQYCLHSKLSDGLPRVDSYSVAGFLASTRLSGFYVGMLSETDP